MKTARGLPAFLFILLSFATPKLNAQSSGSGSTSDFFIGGSIFYNSDLRVRTSRDEEAHMAYDGRAGYQIYPHVYLGGMYQVEQDSINTSGYSSDSLNNSSKSNRASYGPSLGYITEALHLNFTYFIESKWNLETTTSTGNGTYAYSGAGFQGDIGYKFPLWGMLIGPQLSYRKFTYDKLSTNNGSALTITPKLEDDTFEPSLVIFLFF
jgi:hypothetical protein